MVGSSLEGCFVGNADGLFGVGAFEGMTEGVIVGDKDGKCVGKIVDGDNVGAMLGLSEGI